MRIWRVEATGQRPVLAETADPVPAAGEALVRIAAAGVNYADLLMITGDYQETPTPPFVPGLELAGRVESLGPGTEGPPPGTRVAAQVGAGAFAEAAVAPVSHLLPLPDAMPDAVAAGFQIAYGTSHLALRRRGRLAAGETLIVLGAAGGVGLTAVEIGARLGARVVAVARGADKLAAARDAGASATLDSAEAPDLTAALRAFGGADVLYDPVGDDDGLSAQRALRPEGRHLIIGFAAGAPPRLKANHMMVKNIEAIGVHWGAYRRFAPDAMTDSLAELVAWYAEGRLAPRISDEVAFDDLPAALELLRERRATGKVVLAVGSESASHPSGFS